MQNVFNMKPPHSDDEPTTWDPIDLTPWLNGTAVAPQPTVGISRTDGLKLLYPGCEHVVFGETEAGKSWLALQCCAAEISLGHDVVYIHYEEGDPGSTIERLLLLGVTPAQIATHLRFVAPARPVRGAWLEPLLNPPPALVVHDGVNEAMSLHGDDTNAADGAATFRRTIIKPFTGVGATSLSADHVTKNGGESRGRYQIGSGHKLNALDGAAILMENIEPFGRGLRGASSVYITKDRPGQLRANGKPSKVSGKTLMGVLTVDATGNSPDFLTLHPPANNPNSAAAADPADKLAEDIYQTIKAQPDQKVSSWRPLRALLRAAGVKAGDNKVRDAIEDLILDGRLTMTEGPRGAKGYEVI
jgi:hypothetical protein